MGTTTIDVIQSAQITALQDDVVELKDKLNAAVGELNKAVADIAELRTQEVNTITDITNVRTQVVNAVADIDTIKGKVNTLITDTTSLKNKITSGYSASQTTGGGSSSDSILKRLSDLDKDYKELSDHYQQHVTNAYDNSTYGHSSGGRSGNRGGGGSIGTNTTRYIDISSASTSSSGSVTQTSSTPTSQSSSNPAAQTSANAANASVTGVYSATGTKVVTIQDDSATRAREVARSTLTRLRDI